VHGFIERVGETMSDASKTKAIQVASSQAPTHVRTALDAFLRRRTWKSASSQALIALEKASSGAAVPSLDFFLDRLSRFFKSRRYTQLIRDTISSTLATGEHFGLMSLAEMLSADEHRELVPVEEYPAFLRVLRVISRDSTVEAAARMDNTFERLIEFQLDIDTASRSDDERRTMFPAYADLVSSVAMPAVHELTRGDAHLGSLTPSAFDAMQLPLLQTISDVASLAFKDAPVALGVNMMHRIGRTSRWWQRATTRSSRNGAANSIYGAYINSCDELLLVGPCTKTSSPFENFYVPVIGDVSKELVFPGAPRALQGRPDVILQDEKYLIENWPKGASSRERESLQKYLKEMKCGGCISLPVAGPDDKIIAVVNINCDASHAADLERFAKSNRALQYMNQLLQPLMVLLGCIEHVRLTTGSASPSHPPGTASPSSPASPSD
jgi:hypothetical protein